MLRYSLEELINSNFADFKDFQSRQVSTEECCSEYDSSFWVTADGTTSVGVQGQSRKTWKGSQPSYKCIVRML